MTERMIVVSGKVTDFNSNPLQEALVEIKNSQFKTIYKAYTDDKGEYQIHAEKSLYTALCVCKDYKLKYLEYWAWNVPVYHDLQLNPRIGGIEVYAMNAFVPQGAFPSLLIYFRPMSLKRSLKKESSNSPEEPTVIDISPDLSKDDIELRINDNPVSILEINRVKEYAGGIRSIIAYLLQLTMPRKSIIAYLIQSAMSTRTLQDKSSGYLRIDATLRDKQTGERGEGCLFWKRQQTETVS
jgi:hypothetical protein